MRMRILTVLAAAILCLCCSPRMARGGPCLDADLIVRGGHIVTMDSGGAIVSALAIRDGRILARGTDDEIAGCSSARTKIVDLHGQTVLPGLIDVHTHTMEWAEGILRDQLDVTYPKVHSIADIVAMVRERAAKTPKGQW
ncbi:MAG TPA: amidohydrolase family protein, partial [Verrucomicrobiae bacterium]|nr:amidohydrolase family protein [Verrucomicrobiae bacterium]